MIEALTRRRLMGIAAGAAPLVALGGTLAAPRAQASVLLVHDATLPAARRFAIRARTLGVTSQALQGERVRLVRQLLAQGPDSVFGMTRHADRLLFADIAREMGYEELAAIQHRSGRDTVAHCDRALASLTHAAGPCWPEAFAELALGAGSAKSPPVARGAEAGFSWVLQRRG